MDLNCCSAFVAVIQCGSFSKAARQLGIPRSTVSARVVALETRLGTRLLRRTTRQIALTDDGRRYFEEVAPAIHTLGQAEKKVRHSGDTLTGSIRISVPLDFPLTVLSQSIASFRAIHPDIRFDVLVDNSVNDFVNDISILPSVLDIPGTMILSPGRFRAFDLDYLKAPIIRVGTRSQAPTRRTRMPT